VSVPVTTTVEPAQPRSLAGGLWQRFGGLVRDLGKFGVVGILSFAIDVAIFNVLRDPIGVFWAAAASMTVAASVAFVGNRFWTWRHRERSGLHREYLLYFAFNLVGLAITEVVLWLSHSALGHFWPDVFQTRLADNLAKNGLGMAIATLFRFWSYRRFVFPEAATPAGDDSVA
jgi:putative flippase GtrA